MKIGADPEVFLVDAAGAFISSIGRIGGSKENPRPLFALGDGFAVQEDNVALEYNIPAAESAEELKTNINKVMAFLRNEVAAQGLAFANVSAVSFPEDQLRNPAALEFGCEPDYNAWTLRVNPRPAAKDKALRSCGGHVHIGHQVEDAPRLIRACDLYLGVPSVLQDNGELRKELYGKAGAFRPKPYGAEYRTLSNYWIFKDSLIEWVYRQTAIAVDHMDRPIEDDKAAILDAIDNNNKAAAQHLIEKYNIQLAYA